MIQAFTVLADPVRQKIVEFLASGEQPSGRISNFISKEFSISQPAVSQHLKVLRDTGMVKVQTNGTRRIYSIDGHPLRDIDIWLDKFRRFWEPKLEALDREITRGKKMNQKVYH